MTKHQLFCGRTHQVKKFILHTNYPNHYDFSIYERCEFRIPVGAGALKPDFEMGELIINPRQGSFNVFQIASKLLKLVNNIFFRTSWSDIADRLCEPVSRPVNLRRTSSANNTNPWGSTVIFELLSLFYKQLY